MLDAIKVFTEWNPLINSREGRERREGEKKEAEALETWPSAAGLHSSYATIGTEPAPSSRYHPSSAQLSSGFLHFLPNFCLKLILQLPPLSRLQDRLSAVERSIRARTPFIRIRRIVQLENRKGTFIDSITFIYTYIFSREMIPSGSLSSPPSSVFPSRAAALTSDFLEWEALRLHRVIRFHEGTLKFKSPADRLFLSPFFPNRGWKWIYSRGNAALRRIGKSREEEREDGRE